MITASVGIDLSMNSTGLVFIINDPSKKDPILKFIVITNESVPSSASCRLVTYKRDYRNENYSYRDIGYLNSAKSCAAKIRKLMLDFQKTYNIEKYEAAIEAPIMGRFTSQSRLNELVVYNAMAKMMLLQYDIVESIAVVAPTTLKKLATGKGNCKKTKVLETFLEEFPDYDNTKGKNDDVADAYYLAKGPIPNENKFFKNSK
jgi:Holliday junction resolvasome RuvABC endonuclease subunit